MSKDYEVRFTANPRAGSLRGEVNINVDIYTPSPFRRDAGEMMWSGGSNIHIPQSEIPALITFLQNLESEVAPRAEVSSDDLDRVYRFWEAEA